MDGIRRIELFSADCPLCREAAELLSRAACRACEVSVLGMGDPQVVRRAAELGVRSVPAVAIDGELAQCCSDRGLDEAALRAAGLGRPAD